MPTALEYLHAIAEKIGPFDRRVTTSAGTTSTAITSEFVNSSLSSSEFANAALLIETGALAGEQGMLTVAPLTKTSGTVTTGTVFSSSVASGVTFSLYSALRLPAMRQSGRPGLLEIVNQALERTWVEDTLTIAGVTGQKHYTIDASVYPWWSDNTRIVDVQRPVTSADDVPIALSYDQWRWVSDGETRKLRLPGAPFSTGENFTVKVHRPGNSRLKKNAHLRAVLTGTAVTSVTVVNGGYYTALPTIAPATGAATFTAVMAATPGPITSVTVGAGGAYTATFPPALVVTRGAADSGWADQTSQRAGLTTLTDEAIPDVNRVQARGLVLAFELLAEMGSPGQTVSEWLAKAAVWERRAISFETTTPKDDDQGQARIRVALVGGYRRRAWF